MSKAISENNQVKNSINSISASTFKKKNNRRRSIYGPTHRTLEISDAQNQLRKLCTFFRLSALQYMILEYIINTSFRSDVKRIDGTRSLTIDLTEARWNTKKSLAEIMGCSLAAIKQAEDKLKKLSLLVSTGRAGSGSREIALGPFAIRFLTGADVKPLDSKSEKTGKQVSSETTSTKAGIQQIPLVGIQQIPPLGIQQIPQNNIPNIIDSNLESQASPSSSITTTINLLRRFDSIFTYCSAKEKNPIIKIFIEKFGAEKAIALADRFSSMGFKLSFSEKEISQKSNLFHGENILELFDDLDRI